MGALDGQEIKRMSVSPTRRGQRVGQEIYRNLEEEARRRGVARLQLESSLNAVGFYECMGFVREDEHAWTLNNAIITNVIMSKRL
jgi:predicted N-acetyltransferase YhbS